VKILVLAPQWPDPPRQGAAIRNLHILLYLAQRHEVTLLTFLPSEEIERSRIEAVCAHAEELPMPARSKAERLKTLLDSPLPDMAWRLHSEQMRELVREVCSKTAFDAIHVEGIEMAPYGLLALSVQSPSTRKRVPEVQGRFTYDAHNAEYLLQRRAFTTDLVHVDSWPKALYSLVQWWRLRRLERQVCLSSKHVIAVSKNDKVALARLAREVEERITVLPHGVDTEYWSREAGFAPMSLPADSLVFDGTMDFRPNVDAAAWFVKEVWPSVKAERPNARFFIVGRNPAPKVQALANEPGVTVTGAVDDPRPWVAGATVYVVPMRIGGGVRLKVLQAMAMGCAIVSTPMGAEGIDVQDWREMVMARSARQFAQATLSLLTDPGRRSSLGEAARARIVQHYTWEKLLTGLDTIYPASG
jgi:glycosyltransferase involved in cell wall biosynthesis